MLLTRYRKDGSSGALMHHVERDHEDVPDIVLSRPRKHLVLIVFGRQFGYPDMPDFSFCLLFDQCWNKCVPGIGVFLGWHMGTQITPAVEMTRKSRQVSERPVSAQAPARRRIGCIWSSGRSQPHRSPHFLSDSLKFRTDLGRLSETPQGPLLVNPARRHFEQKERRSKEHRQPTCRTQPAV